MKVSVTLTHFLTVDADVSGSNSNDISGEAMTVCMYF